MRARVRRRLDALVARGFVASCPSAWQLGVGWLAMLPAYLSETEAERAVSRRSVLGQVPVRVPLQVLYNPWQAWLGTGLGTPTAAIVKHLCSVFHEDAFLGYDLQLLASEPDGLERLAEGAGAIAAGTGVIARGLRTLVGDDRYHRRLVFHADAATRGVWPSSSLDPRAATLAGFLEYCGSLPDWPPASFYLRRGPGA